MSSAISDQPTIKALLHSARGILASTTSFHGAALSILILDDDGKNLEMFEFDRDADLPSIESGTKLLRTGAVAQVVEQHDPVILNDVSQEMLKHPELASLAPMLAGRSSYLLPLNTSHARYGVLAVTKLKGQKFVSEDSDLLRSLASYVAVVLESVIATDRANRYQRELAAERDRLKLILEINNHVASSLDVNDVFHAASASIRHYFGNDFTGVWLVDRQTNQLQNVLLDFPDAKGFLDAAEATTAPDDEEEKLRRRKPELLSFAEIESLPAPLPEKLKAESIVAMATCPLVTMKGPLGLLAIGSRKPHLLGQQHLDVLSQISVQISLALDNAVSYGQLSAFATRMAEERHYLEEEIQTEYNFEHLIGKSAALRKVLDQIAIVAPTASTVLLRGETGTGKELVARAVHRLSPRRDRTFVRLNCAAIPSGLIESELFGHEKGAFTGALMQKRGRFELADKGTLFLDEIGDISVDLQPKLLRAIQEQEFERLGSTKTIHVDVRLIAATHRNLPEMIRNSQFREDLFYRLNVFPIDIPPLRERREDIPLLVHYFISRLSRRMQKQIRSVPKQAMEILGNAEWRGNVRELENFVERCVILTKGDELTVPVSNLEVFSSDRTTVSASAASRQPHHPAAEFDSASSRPRPITRFQEAERDAIIRALTECSGKLGGKDGAAERLGLKRTTLQHKINKFGINRSDYHRA